MIGPTCRASWAGSRWTPTPEPAGSPACAAGRSRASAWLEPARRQLPVRPAGLRSPGRTQRLRQAQLRQGASAHRRRAGEGGGGRLSPFSHEGGENPYTISDSRRDAAARRDHPQGRRAHGVPHRIEQLKQRAKKLSVEGTASTTPGGTSRSTSRTCCSSPSASRRPPWSGGSRAAAARLPRPGSALGRDQPHPDPGRRR